MIEKNEARGYDFGHELLSISDICAKLKHKFNRNEV